MDASTLDISSTEVVLPMLGGVGCGCGGCCCSCGAGDGCGCGCATGGGGAWCCCWLLGFFDLVYQSTFFLRKARAAGLQVDDGIVYDAVESYPNVDP